VTLCKYKGPEPARSDAEAARTPGDGCARFLVRTCVRPLGEAHDASHYSMVPQAIITHYSMVPQAIITPRNSRQPQALELGTCWIIEPQRALVAERQHCGSGEAVDH